MSRQFAGHLGLIFGGAVGLFLIRLLVPNPVGMADNGDGPRLTCGLGVAPVTGGNERYDGFAYFRLAPSPGTCAHASVYPSSEHLLLVAARWLTPVLGLPGAVNLVALGILTCVLAAAGVAALSCGVAPALRSRLVVAGIVWLVMADGTWFDTFASPYSEGATLTGLLLLAAGLVYAGRGGLASAAGIALAAGGGYLAALSKEQYLTLAVPACAGLVLAVALPAARDRRRGRLAARLCVPRLAAALAAAGLLAAAATGYARQDAASPYTTQLHQEQVVDVIFSDIVPKRIAMTSAQASLRALGLPESWTRYAGHTFWNRVSVYGSPRYARYAGQLTDANLARFLLTHPLTSVGIAQSAAASAMTLRVSDLGSYPPSAGLPPGSLDDRLGIISSIVGVIPVQLGLFWLIPLWAAMIALAVITLRRPRQAPWHHHAALTVICLTGCSLVTFVPAAFFAGVETTRHMLGMNLATALAFVLAATLLASLLRRGLRQEGPGEAGAGQPAAAAASLSWEGVAHGHGPLIPRPRRRRARHGGVTARARSG